MDKILKNPLLDSWKGEGKVFQAIPEDGFYSVTGRGVVVDENQLFRLGSNDYSWKYTGDGKHNISISFVDSKKKNFTLTAKCLTKKKSKKSKRSQKKAKQ